MEGQRRIDRRQPRARHHQLSCGPQAEPQRAVQAHLLLRLEQPAVAALGDEQRDLLGRVHVAVPARGHAQQLQQQHAAAIQQRDRPGERTHRPLHRKHGEERRPGRVLQRERLRHQLAEDDREHRQKDEDDGRAP